jgi:hypothetical protein
VHKTPLEVIIVDVIIGRRVRGEGRKRREEGRERREEEGGGGEECVDCGR